MLEMSLFEYAPPRKEYHNAQEKIWPIKKSFSKLLAASFTSLLVSSSSSSRLCVVYARSSIVEVVGHKTI